MEHQDAVRTMAVEKYFLEELSPLERDEFEAHCFACPVCATELRTCAQFLESFRSGSQSKPVSAAVPRSAAAPRRAREPWFRPLFRPAVAAPAFALLLSILAYQNLAVFPRAGETAAVMPEVLPALSLVTGNSRGANIPSITVPRGQSILVSLDVPTRDDLVRYDCVLAAPDAAAAWHVDLSAEAAKDTVAIRIPTRHWMPGNYVLIVRGYADGAGTAPAKELARYRFSFNNTP